MFRNPNRLDKVLEERYEFPFILIGKYCQHSPFGHPAITYTQIIQTAAKFQAKKKLLLIRTLTQGPYSVAMLTMAILTSHSWRVLNPGAHVEAPIKNFGTVLKTDLNRFSILCGDGYLMD